jgi:hypothetical protein
VSEGDLHDVILDQLPLNGNFEQLGIALLAQAVRLQIIEPPVKSAFRQFRLGLLPFFMAR